MIQTLINYCSEWYKGQQIIKRDGGFYVGSKYLFSSVKGALRFTSIEDAKNHIDTMYLNLKNSIQ